MESLWPPRTSGLSVVSITLTSTDDMALLITHSLFPICAATLRNLTDFAFSCPLVDLTTLTYCLLPRGRKTLPRSWVPFQRLPEPLCCPVCLRLSPTHSHNCTCSAVQTTKLTHISLGQPPKTGFQVAVSSLALYVPGRGFTSFGSAKAWPSLKQKRAG